MTPRLILLNCLSGSKSRGQWSSRRGGRSRMSTAASSRTPALSGHSTGTCPSATPTCLCRHCPRGRNRRCRRERVRDTASKSAPRHGRGPAQLRAHAMRGHGHQLTLGNQVPSASQARPHPPLRGQPQNPAPGPGSPRHHGQLPTARPRLRSPPPPRRDLDLAPARARQPLRPRGAPG
ncbi:E2B hypothetical protein [Human adenovirus 43]|uniref:Uncharacterized protein n=1 Tax=Human adenovirus 43 TaxID=46938 RepID=M1LDL2_9ADEN|nr:E2B hypothetical protein [Human adenovirus 43]